MTSATAAAAPHDGRKAVPLIVLVGLLAYANSFTKAFILDDMGWIADNPNFEDPIAYVQSVGARPVGAATMLWNYWLGGKSVLGYHAFNLAIHLAAALTLFGLVRRTLLLPRWQGKWEQAADWLALSVALLWLVHPLQTQAVTYVIQRLESLMGLFYLLTLYCLLRGATGTSPPGPLPSQGRGWGVGWYVAAVVCFALGMGTKEVMATAPLVALLYDRTFLAGSFGGALRQRWGLYVALALIWGVVVPRQLLTEDPTVGFSVPTLTPLQYLMTQPGVLLHYVRLAFWPYPQSLDYQGWPLTRSLVDCLVPGSVVVAALLGTLWALWRCPWLGFLGACFFLILAPTSSFIPIIDVAFEHRMYLSLAPLVVLVVLGGWEGLRWLARRFGWQEAVRRGLGAGLVCLLVGILTTLTILRNEDYRSGRTIWAAVLQQWPKAPRAHTNLAISYLGKREDFDRAQARQHLEEAVKFAPGDGIARQNLSLVLWWAGEEERAIREMFKVAKALPGYPRVRSNLGKFLLMGGRAREAAAHLQAAVDLEPRRPDYHFALALALQELGKRQEAKAAVQAGLRLKRDWPPEARRNAWALLQEDPAKRGHIAKEVLLLARQASLATGDEEPAYLDTLAVAYVANGEFPRAVTTAREAQERARVLGQDELAAVIGRKRVECERGLLVSGASTAGLLSSPFGQGPVLAASALFPGRVNYGRPLPRWPAAPKTKS